MNCQYDEVQKSETESDTGKFSFSETCKYPSITIDFDKERHIITSHTSLSDIRNKRNLIEESNGKDEDVNMPKNTDLFIDSAEVGTNVKLGELSNKLYPREISQFSPKRISNIPNQKLILKCIDIQEKHITKKPFSMPFNIQRKDEFLEKPSLNLRFSPDKNIKTSDFSLKSKYQSKLCLLPHELSNNDSRNSMKLTASRQAITPVSHGKDRKSVV